MRPTDEQRFDAASFLTVGARDYQEDALATQFGEGADFGIVVLSDGMGGHAAGDVASRIVVEEVFSHLKNESENLPALTHNINNVLETAAKRANDAVRAHTENNPAVRGMGATLIGSVILHNLLYWISVGDSPLYLYREGQLRQLNEDHSMAPQIDFLVKSGMMDPEVGRTHPDRCALTSVIMGDVIDQIDCPKEPFRLEPDDLLILSSDGIQYLTDQQIVAVLASCENERADTISAAIGEAIDDLDDPEQDNAGFAVIRFNGAAGEEDELYEIAWEEEGETFANTDASAQPLQANGGAS